MRVEVIVVGRKYGQLGNRLLLFAHWIGFATEYGRGLCNPAFEDYAAHFAGTTGNVLCTYPRPNVDLPASKLARKTIYTAMWAATRARLIGGLVPLVDCPDGEHYYLNSPEAIRPILEHRLVVVNGFGFRCEPLLERHAPAIRTYFAPAASHASRIADVVAAARRDVDVLIGVHIRRGDFRTFLGGRWFYSDAQYADFMRAAAALFPGRRIAFLVVSNEPVAADALGQTVRLGSGHLVEDMYALAGCDYLIGPPSTFASWASFYGQVPLCVLDTTDTEVKLTAFTIHSHPKP